MRRSQSLRALISVLASLLVVPLALGTSAGCGSSSGGSPANGAPVAEATAPTEALLGTSVALDGSASSDPDDDLVSFLWVLVSVPDGSAAVLDDPSAARPTFTVDVEGTYVVELVVSDGELESTPVEVTVLATRDNAAPTAAAGPDQSALTGDVITLDGSGSNDPDGDPLDYDWAFESLPEGSAATLRGAVGPSPSFTSDVAGEYVVRLVVSDGRASSPADRMTVTVTPDNMAPIANAGDDVTVVVGEEVIFDGRASTDPDGDPLSYRWTLASRPEASALTAIENSSGDRARIFPDAVGTFVARLVVSDGTLSSPPDDVVVTAEAPDPAAPEPPASEEPPPSQRCAPEANLIFCDALDGSTSSNRRDGGTFENGGWRSPGQIVWDLGRTLTSGRFSATLENWNPAADSPQHRHSKQHILNMFEASHASIHTSDEQGTGWFNVRTGRVYRDMFKFYSSTRGFGDGNRHETYHSPPGGGRIDPSVPHVIEVVWGGGEISGYVDGVRVVTHSHPRDLRFRYVVIGTDSSPGDAYGPQHDVLYKDIKVYSSP